ncbi:MAG: hypothetical protein ABID35_04750 [Candidatus Margulisiibacteriota bacterium]
MNILQMVSIGIELVAAVLGVLLAVGKKKPWGWCIALCFAIYVYYDLARLFNFAVSQDLLRSLFFLASISILWAIWQVYKEA